MLLKGNGNKEEQLKEDLLLNFAHEQKKSQIFGFICWRKNYTTALRDMATGHFLISIICSSKVYLEHIRYNRFEF